MAKQFVTHEELEKIKLLLSYQKKYFPGAILDQDQIKQELKSRIDNSNNGKLIIDEHQRDKSERAAEPGRPQWPAH